MNQPLVTIVCLCYNHEKFVLECLKSIENQTYSNIEIIVVDDFSQDKSVEVIEKYLKSKPEIHFIKNSRNLGNTKSFNQALRMSKGAFILDLAADDVLMAEAMEILIEGFHRSSYQNLAAVFGNCLEISENGAKLNYFFEVDDNEKVIKPIKTGDIYEIIIGTGKNRCSASALFRKEVYEKLNAYDESLFYEDLDLWVRASRIYNFDYVDQVVIKKRVVQNSMGTLFHAKKDPRRKIINRSALIIVKKAFHLNCSKSEDKSLLKRVHYNIVLNYKLRDWGLMLQYVLLALKLRNRIWS